jgi:rubrerythrin
MQDKKIKINRCVKCNHNWKQRGKKKPKKCPSCTSPNWDKMNEKDLISLIVGN